MVGGMTELLLDAPIVAVAVYPDRARITRRGRIGVPAGDQTVYVEPLPLGLEADSIRVAGRGPATVLGVDLVMRHHAQAPDETVEELDRQRREAENEVGRLADADDVQAQLDTFLEQLAQRAGNSFAKSLAGRDGGADLTGFTDSLATRMADVRARRRELAEQQIEAQERLAAIDRRLQAVLPRTTPDRRSAAVALAVETESEIVVEVSYVVPGARWTSSYDVRLTGERLTLNWYGLVTQHTGEDWPECELTLSTARPAAAAKVPELDPWYLDRFQPPPPMSAAPAPGGAFGAAQRHRGVASDAMAFMDEEQAPMTEVSATVEQGMTAASYTPARPAAVPADGASHRVTIAAVDLEAELDYVVAPVRSTEVHLRATVVNSSEHALPAGKAAVFHESEFVGSAALPVWAPGEDVELALGLDDRVRVERKLVRRTAGKATLGSTRRREVEYETTIANHTPRPARITVLDQIPVSRDHEIAVKDLTTDPQPAESTELGELTWKLELQPGREAKVKLGFRVETAKNVQLSGWRE